MSDMSALGRLQKIDLRNIWKSEALDFTPWLAEEANLSLLSETLGIDLELEAVERNVGPFRADILCQDTSDGTWVLIENQLERTDQTHLGQLITYAAGLDAVTIVWISARVADEHRAAADWLNEITKSNVRFFVLEVELWKIGDSPAAPKFNIVSKPNDWSRSTAQARNAIAEGELSPTRLAQKEFWSAVEGLLGESPHKINPVKPLAQSWLYHGIGRTGFSLGMSMNTRENWIRVAINLMGETAKSNFDQLAKQRRSIETRLGYPLEWQRLEDKTEARICITRHDTDPLDRQTWPQQHAWLIEKLSEFHTAFGPVIRGLSSDTGADPS